MLIGTMIVELLTQGQMQRLSRFCIYLRNKIIVENKFSWEDVMNLPLYFPASLCMTAETLSVVFTSAFNELTEMDPKIKIDGDSIFNLVPVLGAGRSGTMTDIITCELFAQIS